MATAVKRKLSESVNGLAIKISSTGSPGTLIHQAVSGDVAGTFDEIWLWAVNSGGQAVILTLEWGGTTVPDNVIRSNVLGAPGVVPLIPGFILQNGLYVRAYASIADMVSVYGFVNSITD